MRDRTRLVPLVASVVVLACAPSSDSEDDGDPAVVADSASTPQNVPAVCTTWCGGYPVSPGCDEDDDGVGTEESGGGDDTGLGMGDDIPLGASIFDVQQGGLEEGTLVELSDVIVTSPAAPLPIGPDVMFTVSEAEGGPHSGISVRMPPGPVTATLQPGDSVTVVGRRSERYIFSLIEAKADQVEITGSADLPPPVVVPAEEIYSLGAGSEFAATLESVVVQILEPEVTDPEPCSGEVELGAAVRIDNRFLTAGGETLPAAPPAGYGSVTGPLLYTYNGFEVAPRTVADIED